VTPDVEVPAGVAHDVAYRRVSAALLATDPQRPTADEAREALAALS
jgi:hypothetical protein